MHCRSQFRTKVHWRHAFALTSEKFRRYRDAKRRRSRVAGKSGFLETGTTTQWITGRHAFGCIVNDDESSFAGYGCRFPFPSGTRFQRRGHQKSATRVRSRSFAKRKAINPNNFLPSPQSYFLHTVKLSKKILNTCISNLCNNYRNIIMITVIINIDLY